MGAGHEVPGIEVTPRTVRRRRRWWPAAVGLTAVSVVVGFVARGVREARLAALSATAT
jgi:hypothetical protein